MIKIHKDLRRVPPSLNSQKTQEKRAELIDKGKYINTSTYNNRYKQEDIKNELKRLYNSKCGFCEKDVTDHTPHVEHYRPKAKYWWLAYSWDNLLLACEECNRKKSDNFECAGNIRVYKASDSRTIHQLAITYNKQEKPKLVHPELEDITNTLQFTEKGEISSTDVRMQYTIDVCGISRPEANDQRKKLWDDFKKEVRRMIYFRNNERVDASTINQLIRNKTKGFYKDALEPTASYSAFKRYAIKNFPVDIN